MDQFDKNIFQQLISDTDFIRWAKGNYSKKSDFWANWKNENPQYCNEFNQAVKSVQSLNFSSQKLSNIEIQYLWKKAENQFAKQKSRKPFKKFIIGFSRIAAILIIPLLVYTIWLNEQKKDLQLAFSSNNYTDQEITVLAPVGSRSFIVLPDGTKAWLNSGTRLSYPAIFNAHERKVKIEGEAYFNVVKNAEIPFVVENLGPSVKVYGTEFNINSYGDESVVTVALVEGKVALQINGKEHFLSPGQVSYFDKSRKAVTIRNESVDHFVCWREGKFIFRDTPLSSILRIVQRRYNVDIDLVNPELGNYKYNATFQDEGLEQILGLLQISAPIDYKYIKRDLSADESGMKGKVIIKADKKRIVKH